MFLMPAAMALDVSPVQLEEAKRMSQKALETANQAYQAQLKQPTSSSAMQMSALPTTQAQLPRLQAWINQAQTAQLLASQSESKLKGILFVSFSMPEASIKNYLKQASLINGGRSIKLAIRGLDESNSLIKTQQRLARLMTGVNAQVDIDPGAFDRFNIAQVPALVFYEEDAVNDALCALKGEKPSTVQPKQFMVYGEVSLLASIEHLLKTNQQAKPWRNELMSMRDAVIGKF